MGSSNSPLSQDSNTQKDPILPPKFVETPISLAGESSDTREDEPPADMEVKPENTNSKVESGGGDEEGEEGEEEGECGFCLYMKGGGCKEAFIAWEKCVEENEEKQEDIVEKCSEVTAALKKCMEAHPNYYGPLLQAEKAAVEEAERQLEQERRETAQ